MRSISRRSALPIGVHGGLRILLGALLYVSGPEDVDRSAVCAIFSCVIGLASVLYLSAPMADFGSY